MPPSGVAVRVRDLVGVFERDGVSDRVEVLEGV